LAFSAAGGRLSAAAAGSSFASAERSFPILAAISLMKVAGR
jgi:hypothetical protein